MHKRLLQWCLSQSYFVNRKNWRQPENLMRTVPSLWYYVANENHFHKFFWQKCWLWNESATQDAHALWQAALRDTRRGPGSSSVCGGTSLDNREAHSWSLRSVQHRRCCWKSSLSSQICVTAHFNMLRRKRLKKGSRSGLAQGPWP